MESNRLHNLLCGLPIRTAVVGLFASGLLVACGDDDGGSGENTSGGGGEAGTMFIQTGGSTTGGQSSTSGNGGTSAGGTSTTGGTSSGGTSSGGTSTGGTSSGGVSSGGAGGSGQCLNLYQQCDDNPSGCCAGTACADSGGIKVCQTTCLDDSDCATECCLFDGTAGANLCKAPTSCCSDEGGPCDNMLKTCCGTDLICVAYENMTMPSTCQPRCMASSECATGCCFIFPGGNFGFCAEPMQCQ